MQSPGSNRHQVVGIIGSEGTGKSSLARRIWDELNEAFYSASPDAVVWWNFQSEPDANEFFRQALDHLIPGDSSVVSDASPSGNARAHRLGAAASTRRCLFVLDGLEAVQHHTGAEYGLLRNPDLRRFLEFLASTSNPSMVLLTSRIPVAELEAYATYRSVVLGDLSLEEARALSGKVRATGPDVNMDSLLGASGTNPLVVSLLAGLVAARGDNRATNPDFEYLGTVQSQQERVDFLLSLHDQEVTDPERVLLYILAYLRKPISDSEVRDLSRTATRYHLVETLNRSAQWDIGAAEADLRSLVLRGLVERTESQMLTMHPLIQQHYRSVLAKTSPPSVLSIHQLLADHFRVALALDKEAVGWLELDRMAEVVHHECRCGEFDSAFDLLAFARSTDTFDGRSVVDRLGAHDTELLMAAEFMQNGDLFGAPMIDGPAKAYVIQGIAVDCLSALGRPAEALPLAEQMQRSALGQGFLAEYAARFLLAELGIATGHLDAAIDAAIEAQSAAMSLTETDPEWATDAILAARASLAWAYHLQGRVELAAQSFAETTQDERLMMREQDGSFRHGLFWIRYAEHLRWNGEEKTAREIGTMLARENQSDIRADALRLLADLETAAYVAAGYSSLEPFRDSGLDTSWDIASAYDAAVSAARAGMGRSVLIDALQTRGRWLALIGIVGPAASDLWEALGYAMDGGYRTLEADTRVGLAYERLVAGDADTARAQAMCAFRLAEETGYHWGRSDATAVLELLSSPEERHHPSEEPITEKQFPNNDQPEPTPPPTVLA